MTLQVFLVHLSDNLDFNNWNRVLRIFAIVVIVVCKLLFIITSERVLYNDNLFMCIYNTDLNIKPCLHGTN